MNRSDPMVFKKNIRYHFILFIFFGNISISLLWYVTQFEGYLGYGPRGDRRSCGLWEGRFLAGTLRNVDRGPSQGDRGHHRLEQPNRRMGQNTHMALSNNWGPPLLSEKRIHIVPMEIGYYLIQSLFSSDEVQLITHHPKPILQAPVCLVISRKIEKKRSQWLLELFDRGLKRLKKTGKYDQYLGESRRGEYTLSQ